MSTVLIFWCLLRFSSGSMKAFIMFSDKIGDVVRVTYYLLSCFTNYTSVFTFLKRAKPVLIVLQLIQLALVVLHALIAFSTKCDVPKTFYFIIANSVLLFGLYLRMYLQAYHQKKTHVK